MIELTEEQRQELTGPEPIAIDPHTRQEYVLIRREVYERFRALFEKGDSVDMREVALLVERAMREDDENDPTLAFYQQKYGRKP